MNKSKNTVYSRAAGPAVRLVLSLMIGAVCSISLAAQQPTTNPRPAAKVSDSGSRQYVVIEKPRAGYTERAKYNGVEGTVRLTVELLASGKVGEVKPLTYLSDGLTEQAIAAAKKIRFRPKMFEGKPVDAVLTADYTFSLYYENEDEDIVQRVAITRQPRPEIDASELPAGTPRKISVKVFFGTDGRAAIVNTLVQLPEEQQAKLREAVGKIRFRPAVHRSGKKAGVTKLIEYEL
jgi:TonB family protein